MPKRFITILLALFPLIAFSQTINWDSVRAAYIEEYQPQQMPAWLFPIIVEEGGGQRDTIYLGYDEEASWKLDTLMGEKYEKVDTSRFSACWGGCTDFDSIYFRVKIDNSISKGFTISFHKGILPLKIYWDSEAFYSDSLPFADQNPAPRAQGKLGWNGPPVFTDCCSYQDGVLITDTVVLQQGTSGFVTDSIEFYGVGCAPCAVPYIWFKITPWTGVLTGLNNLKQKQIKVDVHPNPFKDKVEIKILNNLIIKGYKIYNSSGRKIKERRTVGNNGMTTVDLSTLQQGLYIIEVLTSKQIIRKKIIKM